MFWLKETNRITACVIDGINNTQVVRKIIPLLKLYAKSFLKLYSKSGSYFPFEGLLCHSLQQQEGKCTLPHLLHPKPGVTSWSSLQPSDKTRKNLSSCLWRKKESLHAYVFEEKTKVCGINLLLKCFLWSRFTHHQIDNLYYGGLSSICEMHAPPQKNEFRDSRKFRLYHFYHEFYFRTVIWAGKFWWIKTSSGEVLGLVSAVSCFNFYFASKSPPARDTMFVH